MAESFVQLNNDGPGKKIDTFTEATNGQHRQAMVIADPSVTTNVAPVDPVTGLAVSPKTLPPNAAVEVGGHLASLDTKSPTLGQKTMAGSEPVVIASDQSAIPISGTITTTPPANASTNITQIGGTAITEGQKVMASSLPVVLASDQSVVPVSGTVTAVQATGTNLHTVTDTGSTTAVTGNVTVVQPTGTNLHTVVDSGTITLSGTSPVSGTVTANQGTPAVNANKWPISIVDAGGVNVATVDVSGELAVADAELELAQGSTTAGQLGPLVQGAVTSSLPAYTTGQTSPMSLGIEGGLRTDNTINAATLIVSVTGVSGAAVTATLPAIVGMFHYISEIHIVQYATLTTIGAAAPTVITTTNLNGLAFTKPTALAVGATFVTTYTPTQTLRSAAANTATTIVCPATTSIIWRVNVLYDGNS
jgi:hypothetical protein